MTKAGQLQLGQALEDEEGDEEPKEEEGTPGPTGKASAEGDVINVAPPAVMIV